MLYQQALLVLEKSGLVILNLWPYAAGGVLIGEILRYTSWPAVIDRACRRVLPVSVMIAALLGMASPLCTYGTVPLILRLLAAGIHPAPLVTFLCASSLFNPQVFIITWGGIGWEMAVVRTGVTLLISLCLGYTLLLIPRRFVVRAGPAVGPEDRVTGAMTGDRMKVVVERAPRAEEAAPENRTGVLREPKSPAKAAAGAGESGGKIFWERFTSFWRSLEYVGFYLLLGVLLGALVEAAVPDRWPAYMFNRSRWFSILTAAGLGVPLYACGGGVIPFIRALLEQGMSKGAALTFFLVGPATRITPLMALAAVLRPLFLLVYLVVLIVLSVLAGMLYN